MIDINIENKSLLCPICGTIIQRDLIKHKSLSYDLLDAIAKHMQAGSLAQVFQIADIVIANTQQDKVIAELRQKESLQSTQKMITELLDSFHNNQEKLLQEFLTSDENKKKQILSEHISVQDKLIENYKRDVFEKMELIRKTEEARSQEYYELTRSIKELQNKVFGPTIGTIGEVVTILDLKRFCPVDTFSELRANKHGTDIIGEVIEHGKKSGTISISVKYQQKWDSQFITQLTSNMRQDNSRWGILVTKAFPKEALNDKMWTTRDSEGKMVFMVKPEYCSLAYYASRQIAIHWTSVENMIRSKEAAQKEEENIKKKVLDWVAGENFQKTIADISQAIKINSDICNGLISIHGYLSERIRKLRQFGDEVHYFLESTTFTLLDLKQLLVKNENSSESIIRPSPINSSESGGKKSA